MRCEDDTGRGGCRAERELLKGLPQPTASFRRRAWLHFQRALDPLGPLKPPPLGRR